MKGKKASEWLDREWSEKLADLVSAENQECFLNSVATLLIMRDGTYVEGWATTPWRPMLHGWVELADGTVLDTTPAWYTAEDDRTYFAARRYSLADVTKAVEEDAGLPLEELFRVRGIPHDVLHVYLASLNAVDSLTGSNNPTKRAA
jgi:hypothetical protein